MPSLLRSRLGRPQSSGRKSRLSLLPKRIHRYPELGSPPCAHRSSQMGGVRATRAICALVY